MKSSRLRAKSIDASLVPLPGSDGMGANGVPMAYEGMAVEKLGGSMRSEYMWLVCSSEHEPRQIVRCASASKTDPAKPELSGDL